MAIFQTTLNKPLSPKHLKKPIKVIDKLSKTTHNKVTPKNFLRNRRKITKKANKLIERRMLGIPLRDTTPMNGFE